MSLFILGFLAGVIACVGFAIVAAMITARRWSADEFIVRQIAFRRMLRRLPPPVADDGAECIRAAAKILTEQEAGK